MPARCVVKFGLATAPPARAEAADDAKATASSVPALIATPATARTRQSMGSPTKLATVLIATVEQMTNAPPLKLAVHVLKAGNFPLTACSIGPVRWAAVARSNVPRLLGRP